METTSTFIDYAFDSFGGGEFSIETKGSMAVLRLALNHPEFAEAYYFDRDTARQLGTNLLQWNGSHTCCTLEPVEFVDTSGDVLRVEVIDGTVMFLLSDGNFQATDAEVVDLAQRLIVWAGVDTRAVIHS
jgi:hypothetical protein